MGAILGITFLILMVIGTPIPWALGVATLAALIAGDLQPILIPQRMIAGIDSFSLLAVPFFILAGELMRYGGLSERLIDLANKLLGHVTAGLAMVTVTAAMFFAALSGSAPATTAAIGSITIPEMVKRGYRRDFSTALAVAAGPIGQMIPPSIPMIIWGVLANVSISRLFLAGAIPGILMGITLMVVSYFWVKRSGLVIKQKRASLRDTGRSFLNASWALMTSVIILGGIYGGIFTPTEAAVAAVIYALLIGFFIYRSIKLSMLPSMFINAARTTTLVMLVVATASLFGWIMASEQLANQLAALFLGITDNPIILLLMLNAMLLLIGAFMDTISAMVILVGVLGPLSQQIGIDPVQFGAMVVINFAIGMTTPPIGYSLFVGSSVSGLSIEQVSRAIWPFLCAMIVVLLLIAFFPPLTLWLPNLVLGAAR